MEPIPSEVQVSELSISESDSGSKVYKKSLTGRASREENKKKEF